MRTRGGGGGASAKALATMNLELGAQSTNARKGKAHVVNISLKTVVHTFFRDKVQQGFVGILRVHFVVCALCYC